MRINRNETLRNLNEKDKKADIYKLIVKYNLNNDLYNTSNKKFINFLCLIRIKNIILISMIISIIIGLIIFFILFHSDKNNKMKISFKQYINNTNIDGYYIPKGNILEPKFKKCSIEYCKRCYGNLYNDTCTSCLDSYVPILDEHNKIISCQYRATDVPTVTYITFNETYKINSTYNQIDVTTNYIKSKHTDNLIEIKSDFPIENITNKTTEPSAKITIENTFSTINESSNEMIIYKTTEFESPTETITYIISDIVETTSLISEENLTKEGFTIDNSGQTSILSETFTEIISEIKTEFPSRIYSEIHLVVQGNGKQKLLDDHYYNDKEPSEVLVNGVIDNSCKKTCNLNANKNYITLRFNTSIESCYSMFDRLDNIIEVDLSYFDASKVKDMGFMFNRCTNLEKIEFGNINTSSLNNMIAIFQYCERLKSIDFSNFDISGVTNMDNLCGGCEKLEKVEFGNINTSSVENMRSLFRDCYALTSIDLSKFDTSKVTKMEWMFSNDINLTYLDLSNFNTANLKTIYNMFYGCSSLIYLNLKSFKLKKTVNKDNAFFGISSYVKYCIEDIETINFLGLVSDCSDDCFKENIIIENNKCIVSN